MSYRITLEKEYFHFCSAHFVIFSATEKEGLHGHNYYLSLTLSGDTLREGKLFDIDHVKQFVRDLCDTLDHHLLLPATNPHLTLHEGDGYVDLRYAALSYRIPSSEVRILPLDNITMENLARYLAGEVRKRYGAELTGIDTLELTVRETRGQSASIAVDWKAA